MTVVAVFMPGVDALAEEARNRGLPHVRVGVVRSWRGSVTVCAVVVSAYDRREGIVLYCYEPIASADPEKAARRAERRAKEVTGKLQMMMIRVLKGIFEPAMDAVLRSL